MARPKVGMCTRQVTARFWDNEELAELEHSSNQPKLRLTMIGLWAASDAAGRFEWRPRMLAPKIYPFFPEDQAIVEPCMNLFVEHGYLLKYEVDGKWYGAWPHWSEHNDFREAKSVYPSPGDSGVSRGNEPPSLPHNVNVNVNVNEKRKSNSNVNANGKAAAELPSTGIGTATMTSFSLSTDKGNTVQGTGSPDVCIPHGVSVQNKVIPTPGCPRCDPILRYIKDHNLPAPDKTKPPRVERAEPEEEDDYLDVSSSGKRVATVSTQTTILARLLYAALPQDRKDEAAQKWEELWAADIEEGLLTIGEEPNMIARVLRALPGLAKSKFVYRGDSFVKMYPKLKADVLKLEKKK